MEIVKISLDNSFEDMEKILKEFNKIEINEKNILIDKNKIRLNNLRLDSEDLEEINSIVFNESKEVFDRNFKSFFLLKENFLKYYIFKAFFKQQENGFLVLFDSCLNSLDEKMSNDSWLRHLIKEGYGRRLVLVGIRNFSKEEIDFLKENEINIIKMEFLREELREMCDLIMERANNSGNFFIGLDISCIDPSFAPGSKKIVPGGISSSDMIYFLKRLSLLKNFKGICLSGFDIKKDINEITSKLSARLMSECV